MAIDPDIMDNQATAEAKAARLKRLRHLTNLERSEVSDKYGINNSTLKGWETARANGLSSKGAKQFIKIAEQEGVICSYDWLMHGKGLGPRIIDKFQLQKNESTLIINVETQILRELQLFKEHCLNAIDFIVNDDGMAPYFDLGDYIAGIRHQDDFSSHIGKNCIIQTADGTMTFRKLLAGKNEKLFTLTCTNPHNTLYEPICYNIEIISVAPVIWHRKK